MIKQQPEAGFTLLELIITILIFSILLGLALPAFTSFIDRTRLNSGILEMHGALQLTRTQAVASGQEVKFCPLDEQGRCSTFSTLAVRVFVDHNRNNRLDPGELLLRQIELRGTSATLRVSAARPYIRYRRTGDALEWGSLTLCKLNSTGQPGRQIIVSIAGRTRLAQDSDNDGYVEDAQGNPVRC